MLLDSVQEKDPYAGLPLYIQKITVLLLRSTCSVWWSSCGDKLLKQLEKMFETTSQSTSRSTTRGNVLQQGRLVVFLLDDHGRPVLQLLMLL